MFFLLFLSTSIVRYNNTDGWVFLADKPAPSRAQSVVRRGCISSISRAQSMRPSIRSSVSDCRTEIWSISVSNCDSKKVFSGFNETSGRDEGQ